MSIARVSDAILGTWLRSPRRKPLLLRGARQVGKSTAAELLALREGFSLCAVNFEREPELRKIFQSDLDPRRIVSELRIVKGWSSFDLERSLLFFDEVQECQEALRAVRYLYEEAPHIPLIASGSLLEFEIERVGVPVGRVETLHLYPLSFLEFLGACGKQSLVDFLDSYQLNDEIGLPIHHALMEYLALYSVVGGMPEIVNAYIERGEVELCQKLQTQLVTVYRQDFTRYAKQKQLDHVSLLFQSVPRLVARRFKFSEVSREIRSSALSSALDLLTKAHVVHKVVHTSGNGVPLGAEASPGIFKCFFLDCGLAQRIGGLELSQWILSKRDFVINRGPIAEQFVAQELLTSLPPESSPELYYWQRDKPGSSAEVDFLAPVSGRVVPIEVKAGSMRPSKSLQIFLNERPGSRIGVELCGDLPYRRDSVHFLPLYLAGQVARLVGTAG